MIAIKMDLMQRMSLGMAQPVPFDHHMIALMMIPGMIFGVAYCAGIFILLFIHRHAFDPPLQPVPLAAAV